MESHLLQQETRHALSELNLIVYRSSFSSFRHPSPRHWFGDVYHQLEMSFRHKQSQVIIHGLDTRTTSLISGKKLKQSVKCNAVQAVISIDKNPQLKLQDSTA